MDAIGDHTYTGQLRVKMSGVTDYDSMGCFIDILHSKQWESLAAVKSQMDVGIVRLLYVRLSLFLSTFAKVQLGTSFAPECRQNSIIYP